MIARRIALLASVSLLAGCASMGPPDARADIVMPSAFTFAPPNDNAAIIPAERLLPLQDPAFAALLKRASDAPDLAIALARIDAARAVARRAGADR